MENQAIREREMKEKTETTEQIAQWVIDNRYPKSEYDKVSDSEMYFALVERIVKLLEQNLREELIKYEIFCDSLIPFSPNDLVDRYLKQRKP